VVHVDINWIHLAQDRNRVWDFSNTLMNFLIP